MQASAEVAIKDGRIEMDPISVALLLAVAGGMGTGAGEEVWRGLNELVHKPFRHRAVVESVPTQLIETGVVEVARLERDHASRDAARRLAQVIAARAERDSEFSAGLQVWLDAARSTYPGNEGGVHNEMDIRNSTLHQPVIQSGSVGEINFYNGPSEDTTRDE
jgi:hypothetical protein